MAITPIPDTDAHQNIINNFILPSLGFVQKIPLHNEVGVVAKDRRVVRFIYGHWLDSFPIIVRRNRTIFLTEGTDYTVDEVVGEIALTQDLAPGDEIDIDYYFQYFTNQELVDFLELTLRDLNSRKPATAFTMENAPLEWDGALVTGVMIKCIERMMLDFNLWRPYLIWVDPSWFRDFLSTMLANLTAQFAIQATIVKRRGLVAPAGVSSGRYATSQLVDGANFRQFSIGGGGFT